jgi:hypothetical protein
MHTIAGQQAYLKFQYTAVAVIARRRNTAINEGLSVVQSLQLFCKLFRAFDGSSYKINVNSTKNCKLMEMSRKR